jgi:hypothetical protein
MPDALPSVVICSDELLCRIPSREADTRWVSIANDEHFCASRA